VELALSAPALAVCGVTAMLADVEGFSPEGTVIGIILRADDGMLTELEMYARDGLMPISIPGAEQLRCFW
jgi:hypothetical protein